METTMAILLTIFNATIIITPIIAGAVYNGWVGAITGAALSIAAFGKPLYDVYVELEK